jgi:cytochrome P450
MTIAARREDCATVFEAGLPALDYDDARNPAEAHDAIHRARRLSPIALGRHGPELLTYELVHSALRDPRLHMPVGMILAAQGITSGPLWDRISKNLISLDGDEHHRLRRLVSKAFTPRATRGLHTIVSDVMTDLVDQQTAKGSCDVVTDIARRYPIPIICALLGAPAEDWELFSDWTDDIFKAFSWNAAAETTTILAAWDEFDAYLDDMVAHRRDVLADDLLSELIRAEDDGDRLAPDELRMLAAGLLMAGTDTTRNQVAASVDVLCDHPEQWRLLGEHPEFACDAVEETMRHSPVAFATFRTSDEDVELAAVTIPAGTMILANTAAANRDPAIYDDPDRFDITRSGAPSMQTFGGGVHYCLGAHLARLELVAALTIMPRRMPDIRRAGEAPWKPLNGLSGPTTLPVEFTPSVR